MFSNKFNPKLNCLSNSKYTVDLKLTSLIHEKDIERERKDKELEMQRRKEFTDKNVVEEVIEFKGDLATDQEMLKEKMKPKKEKAFVKNPMQQSNYEIRKARREHRERMLHKLD